LSEEQPAEKPVEPVEPIEKEDRVRVSIDDFMKIDLRVARVIEASPIEGADRLLKLRVELGGETRQLVAGIKKSYAPEELVGKHIVVVANLEPARLRGVESQGMLLAATTDDGPVLATFERPVAPGARVK
jgi:methionyl-tRNA synthetase